MPYKDPERKRLWRKMNKNEVNHSLIFFDAKKFANDNISALKQMGVRHTKEEWEELRRELVKSQLKISSLKTLSTDADNTSADRVR